MTNVTVSYNWNLVTVKWNASAGASSYDLQFNGAFCQALQAIGVLFQNNSYSATGTLGSKWTYSFQYLLTLDSKYAYFVTPQDDVIPFTVNLENGTFEPAESGRAGYAMLRNAEESYLVRVPDGTEYLFDSRLSLQEIRVGEALPSVSGVMKQDRLSALRGDMGEG